MWDGTEVQLPATYSSELARLLGCLTLDGLNSNIDKALTGGLGTQGVSGVMSGCLEASR